MDHADLVAEFPVIEKMTPAERIQLARERRALQLIRHQEREKAEERAQNSAYFNGQKSNIIVNDRKPRAVFKPSIILLEATARNDLEEVRRLLLAKADPNAHNEDGLTPLHQCAIDNNEQMLKLFLEFGADVNARDTELWTPLHAAACCGHINIVKHLIENGAALLSVNADGNMPYDICDDDYTLDFIESEMAKRGITQDDIDQERLTPERQMLVDMQELRGKGENLEYQDEFGATPLHIASANGFYSAAQFLLDCGVSTHVRDNDGWQPVHAAACWAQADMLELLVAYGADINARTPTGEMPIDLCEDESVRAVIMSLQVEAQRRRLLSFARDSRRMSKRRKPTSKFESPSAAGTPDGHLVATRGAIRRLSIRDRAGVTLARLEARREAALMRSWSFEDTSKPSESQDESSDFKKTESDSAITTRNGGGTVQLVGGKTLGLDALNLAMLDSNMKSELSKAGESSDGTSDASFANQQKLHKIQNDERKPKQGSSRHRPKKPAAQAEPSSTSSLGPESSTLVVGNGSVKGVGAGAQPTATSDDNQAAFSRTALTLSDLKKQRSEDRKSASGASGSTETKPIISSSAAPAMDGSDIRARFRAPSDAVVGNQSVQVRAPRRKMSLRCCTIT